MDSFTLPSPEQRVGKPQALRAGALVLFRPIAPAAAQPASYQIAKRALDIAISALGLLLSLPLMLVIAVVIRCGSPGPALFRQCRVGKDGRLFTFYKFRTMWADARERFPELYAYRYSEQEIGTLYFKQPDDPRLTPFGRWLRTTSLDELPNFINVLLGQMTLVGPRPEIPQMLPYYTDAQLTKFSVTPGLTGLAQISGRASLRFQETIAADLAYCRQRSLRFDLWIFVMTIKSIVLRSGAF
ncbi:MAG TPA: sugar transferase [Roseiflexaceae bacterium]|nr:sugar transferase [Roseiflexaceae bacterium]